MSKILRIDIVLILAFEGFLTSFALLSSASMSEILPLVIFSSICTAATIRYYMRRRVGVTYFFLWLMIVYLIGFVRLKYWDYFSPDVLSANLLWLTAFVLSFVFFYEMIPCHSVNPRLERIMDSLNEIYGSFRFLLGVFLVYILFYAFEIVESGGAVHFVGMSYAERHDPSSSYLFFIKTLLKSSLLISAYTNFIERRSKLVPILILILIFLLSTVEGSTGALIGLLVPIVVFFVLDRLKNRKLLQLNWIVFAAVILLAVVVSYTAVVRIKRSGSDELSSLVYGRTFDALENSIRITETYEPGEHLGLNIIVYPAVNFVPRSLWPEKPIGLGRRIMFDIYGAPSYTSVSFAPGLLGEFYADFGYFGILVFGSLFGLILKRIDYGILRSLNAGRVGSCFLLLSLALLSSNIPNSPQGYLLRLIITGIFQIIFTLILARIIGCFKLTNKKHGLGSKSKKEKTMLLKER